MSDKQMREAFERWFSSNDCDPLAICRNDDGSYMLTPAEISWASWQAALSQPADRDVMRQAVTEEMARAYLTANTRYWRENDKWRNGTALEAARVSLEAALAAAGAPSTEQQGEQEPVAAILATMRAKVEALHNVSNYDIWFKNQVLALIDKMGGAA